MCAVSTTRTESTSWAGSLGAVPETIRNRRASFAPQTITHAQGQFSTGGRLVVCQFGLGTCEMGRLSGMLCWTRLLRGLSARPYRSAVRLRLSVAALASQHEYDCLADDLEVKPQRRIADIPLVECVFFFRGDELSTVHLCPACYPGA